MDNLSQFFTGTPAWVYILFFYLLFIGIKSMKTGVVSLKKLFILPIIFFFMSLHTLLASFDLTVGSVVIYIVSLALGSWVGWLFAKNKVLAFDKKHHLIKLQGSATTLILVLLIFSIKYYFGYALAVDPTRVQDFTFRSLMIASSGIITGIFIGRAFLYLHKRSKAPHTDLK